MGKFQGAGGTSGGLGTFLLGLAMAVAGCYLILNQVIVTSGFWSIFGNNAFGFTLLPFLIGIGFLFFNAKSVIGWLLAVGGFIVIIVGIITNLHIFFRPTSLFNTLVMLVLLFGGVGLIIRSFRSS